jgi:hypothetical protein
MDVKPTVVCTVHYPTVYGVQTYPVLGVVLNTLHHELRLGLLANV